MTLTIEEWERDGGGSHGNGSYELELEGGEISDWVESYLGEEEGHEEEEEEEETEDDDEDGPGRSNSKIKSKSKGKSRRSAALLSKLRRSIVSLALTADATDLAGLALAGSAAPRRPCRLARLGLLCAAHRHVSVRLARVGASLLQRAVEGGYFARGEELAGEEEEGAENVPVPVPTSRQCHLLLLLSSCHSLVSLSEGFGREDRRLGLSSAALATALTHLQVATNPKAWEESVSLNLRMGKYEECGRSLGVLRGSFPTLRRKGRCLNSLLQASLLLKGGECLKAMLKLWSF